MPLFGRNRGGSGSELAAPVPGLAELATARGWEPVPGKPFDGHLEDAVHETTCAIYGVPPGMGTWQRKAVRIGDTVFRDAYRTHVDGRAVTVANSWTNIQPEARHVDDDFKGVAVCAVELASILPIACVQPRRFDPVVRLPERPTGSPTFDQQFRVIAGSDAATAEVLTSELQQLVMARDDWIFRAERYLFGCISSEPFHSPAEVTARIDQVVAIVAAIPTSVMPDHVDHSADDLIARASKLQSVDEAFDFLQHLTPDERARLASSDSPLAVMADVRTPAEGLARFQSLDETKKLELLAMVMKVKDAGRGG